MTGEIEDRVSQHYQHGALAQAIADALVASGVNDEELTAADLSPVDEFHIGGRQATVEFAEQLGARPGMHLLDIGSGLGGASRYFASERGCTVMSIDLTDEYVRVAEDLAGRVGLAAPCLTNREALSPCRSHRIPSTAVTCCISV